MLRKSLTDIVAMPIRKYCEHGQAAQEREHGAKGFLIRAHGCVALRERLNRSAVIDRGRGLEAHLLKQGGGYRQASTGLRQRTELRGADQLPDKKPNDGEGGHKQYSQN